MKNFCAHVSEISEMTDTAKEAALFFDADCRFCSALAGRFGPLLRGREFAIEPLQGGVAQRRLGMEPGEALTEMKVITREGGTVGGAEAVVYLARFVWWGVPIRLLARLPGGMGLLRRGYRWVARNRACVGGACGVRTRRELLVLRPLRGRDAFSTVPGVSAPSAGSGASTPGYRSVNPSGSCASRGFPSHANEMSSTVDRPGWPGWIPLLVLPVVAALLAPQPLFGSFEFRVSNFGFAHAPAWALMWLLAFAIFVGCKWLTWWDCAAGLDRIPVLRSLGYLFLWPGMDARPFLDRRARNSRAVRTGRLSLWSEGLEVSPWYFATGKTLFGTVLIWGVARWFPPMFAGWIGMIGLIFLLHFGVFHLAALAWQSVGVEAEPIMKMPVAAGSLGEFWSVRWNRGFNALAHRHVFKPARRYLGVAGATLLAFAVSGLIHDLVISVPARGGYGLPTLYFLLQGVGVLVERSAAGRSIGLRRGVRGRFFALVVAAGPVFWLFHPPFVHRVIIPFLEVIKAI